MKAAIYTRVSTEEQSLEGFSLSAQLNALQEYCIQKNIELYDSYCDEGISGTKEDRPAFQRMIADAEKGYFNVVLVHKFDRFARKVEISQRIKSRLKKASVNVISITEPIEDSPIGFFQEGILELLSDYFIQNLRNEIKKGQKQRAAEGYHHGKLPFGYKTKDGLAYIVESEAEIVSQIFELYLQGWGYGKISKYLNNRKITTRAGNNWTELSMYRIIKNIAYTGYLSYQGEILESKTPVIITKEIFDTAQRDRGIKTQRYTYRTNRQNEFLFLGLLKCGECGSTMRLHMEGKNRSYVCNYAARYLVDGKCTFRKHFHIKKTEKRILDFIRATAESIETEVKIKKKVEILDITDNQKNKINKELERAKQAYIAGVFELEEYSQIRKNLEKELNELKINSPAPVIDIKKKINDALGEMNQIPEENIVERKKVLRSIIDSVVISKSDIFVYFL